MKFVPTICILYLIFSPEIYMQMDFDPDDYDDDLRVSNSQPQSSDNYHSISLPPMSRRSNDPSMLQNNQRIVQLPPRLRNNDFGFGDNLKPQKFYQRPNIQSPPEDPFRLSDTKSGVCSWMTLDEFKNVSLDTIEIIIKDTEEQPCYILTMRAHLRLNDTKFVPLNKFRSYHYYKAFYHNPNDGASVQALINCSLSTTGEDGATGPLKTNTPLREEITIAIECGYVVLNLRSQGSSLRLDDLSFYQSVVTPGTQMPFVKTNRGIARTIPQLTPEHLVFTTRDTGSSPLIVTPLVSRFVCHNRVVLKGNNSVEFVSDRLELVRLLYAPSFFPVSKGDKELEIQSSRKLDSRSTRDIKQRKSSPVLVTKCPNPTSPTIPLDSFMVKRVNEVGMRISLPRASAAHRMVPFRIGWEITTIEIVPLSCILILCFLRNIQNKYTFTSATASFIKKH